MMRTARIVLALVALLSGAVVAAMQYTIRSPLEELDGLRGALTVRRTSPGVTATPDAERPHQYTDKPGPTLTGQSHMGARTISRWRTGYLRDFSARMRRTMPVITAGNASWNTEILERAPAWYAGNEARAIAANVITWQSAEGGWPKNIDLSEPATAASLSRAVEDGRTNSLDNDATILPMRFLPKVAGTDPAVERAIIRGLDYLFDAQYPNGGWPQFYPLREGYFSRITFNDNAMTNVLFLLRDIANEEPDFDFVGPDRRDRAAEALQRGVDLILATQIRQDGRLTAWCAQYDQVTLAPAWARTYEPPSLSGMETVAIVRFLMAIERPSQPQIAAIEAAVAWLESVAIYGLQYRRIVDDQGMEDGIVVADPGAGPLWARFYDLHTNRPIFTGRDSVIHYSLDEIEQERRGGYGYYGSWGKTLLQEEYPRWRERHFG